MIVRNDWPEHWETSIEAFGREWVTPNDLFFVRSHFAAPEIDPKSWRLQVTGLVRTPLELSLAELQAMPTSESVCALECAGNGRGLFSLPSTSGTQWSYGAVGNAYWGGVRLAEVLQRAGIKINAAHVWFEAADHATLPSTPAFVRSIPIAKAMSDVLLAHQMNREPLPRLHGAPLRAIVPGWYGMASAKWVTKVRVEAAPSDNHFMVRGYRYAAPGQDPTQAPPVEKVRIKSLITSPLEGAQVRGANVSLSGFAWSGPTGVRGVDVSGDGGKTWRRAQLTSDEAPLSWRVWTATCPIDRAGRMTLMARAMDLSGAIQPLAAEVNIGGYGNNSIHRVTVDARA